ncbi:MAG: preprotein translocase subunit SecA [Bacteroidota bacterium]
MLSVLKKIFGSKSDKDIKEIMPIVKEINRYFDEFNSLTDEQIKAKTLEFKEIIKSAVSDLENQKMELENQLKSSELTADEVIEINDKIRKLDREIFERIEDKLDELLPQAYAVVKQACKRLADQRFAYTYAGQHYIWDMVPYDVQLIGGIVLHQGKISEMATGEGKTLVAIMPLYLNALAGKGAHLVTVNDYLAKRDCEWMRPVYEFLGLTVDAIQSNMEPSERKRIYNCDITYGTNNEFGFDYLRDNMVVDSEHIVQRPHWYAIVDEVDSVLIDEARTPLIISGPVPSADQKFEEMNPRVKRLVEAQNKLVNEIVAEAERLLATGKKEDRDAAGVLLFRAHRGLPKHKKLLKLMQDAENLKLRQETELFFLRDKGARMPEIDEELYYTIDEKNHQIDITEKGRQLLCQSQEDPDMFVIPDIAAELSAIEGNETLTPEEKQQKIDQVYYLFAERSDRIHTISQLLRAYSLYEKDIEYVVQDGKVLIVDEFTGRILEGRRYSDGLHQAIEAKERVKVERDTQTLATITLQNYFRLYKKLAGMTGTAETEAAEFEKIYNLEVVVIPTNKPVIRIDHDDLVYRTKREKYNAILEETKKILQEGRAVLVGTTSVEVSEILSKMFTRQGIKHNVLNAKHHAREAEIVALAGRKGSVTIATNMAGRGTDIKLDHDVKKNGGLAIIGSERHDARRIDRQLRGRAGRQGDPGSSQFFISLEDNLMRLFQSDRIANVMSKIKIPEGEPIQLPMITKAVENAQKKVEENNFAIRKRLIEYDDVMNHQREVIYSRRRAALRGDRLKGEIFEYVEDYLIELYETHYPNKDVKGLRNSLRTTLLCDIPMSEEEFEKMKLDEFVRRAKSIALEFYQKKEEMLGSEFMARLEQVAILQTIDEKWREHLRSMDDLKEGIHLRSYGQKDPLLEYKQEAHDMFLELVKDINKSFIQFAFRYFPQIVRSNEEDRRKSAPTYRNSTYSQRNVQYEHSSTVPSFIMGAPQAQQAPEATTTKTIRNTQVKVGRNDPCPCGSGKKYKKCHGANEFAEK